MLRDITFRGDVDAQRILAQYESPLSRAVGHITTAALDSASDWTKDGNAYRPLEDGRSISTVFEDFLGQVDFDPKALLPEVMKDGVDPMALMLALNGKIRDAKEMNG